MDLEKAFSNEAERSEASDHEDCSTCSEEETRSEDETASPSDEDFIVSDSEMAEESEAERIEDTVELLFESFLGLHEEHKILKNELQKQSCLLGEIHREWKESKAKQSEAKGSEAKRSGVLK